MTTRLVIRLLGRQEVAQPEHLLEDLALGQVPLDPLQSAGAEDTPIPQPTWVLMQTVRRSSSAISTHSIRRPSRHSRSSLSVPSGATRDGARSRVPKTVHSRVELLAQRLGRSDIALEPLGPLLEDPAQHLARMETRVALLFASRPSAPRRSHPAMIVS